MKAKFFVYKRRLIRKLDVAGSSPVSRSIPKKTQYR